MIALARRVAAEAIADSSLQQNFLASDSVGVVFGASKGGLHTASKLLSGSREVERRDAFLDVWPNCAARHIAGVVGCLGPVIAPVAACATGLAACLQGAELIRSGRCDVVLAGSSDASLQPAILGSFLRLGVLARPFGDPAQACRPFDKTRNGFVVGEGAACLILESLDHAIERGARWYAEWIDGRMLSDPMGLTQLDLQGQSLRRLLRDLRKSEGHIPDYINLHGTATQTNDVVESTAIRDVLGHDTDRVACSSLKGGLGHLLGAAGSVELAATLLALRDQTVPPNVNLASPDPDLPLNVTSGESQKRQINLAWKLSLGFGGHLSAACIRHLPGIGDRTR